MVVEQGSEGTGSAAAGTAGESAAGVSASTGGAAGASSGAGGAPGTAAGAATGAAAGAAGVAAASLQDPPAYVPNFKYTVRRQEKEIPEWARAIVTSADAEKQVRDIFERADGLDEVKQHRDVLVNENQQMREQWAPLVQDVVTAKDMMARKDYPSLFEFLGVPQDDILKHALEIVKLREDPAAAAAYQAQRALATENMNLRRQLDGATQTTVKAAENELSQTLELPQIATHVQAFDARMGKPGSFYAEVVRRGQAYQAAGQHKTTGEMVFEVLQLLGVTGGGTPAAAPAPAAAAPAGTSAPAAGGGTPAAAASGGTGAPLPTLPNIKGKSTSPAKVVPKGLDGLRQKGRELAASGR